MTENVIDVKQTAIDIPPKEQRAGYLIPYIKPTQGSPEGGNFGLDKLLEQSELNKTSLEGKSDKTYVDGELQKKVDVTAQGLKDGEQDTKINKNKTDLDDFKLSYQLYTMGFKPKNLATYLGATGSTPEAVCRDAFAKLKAHVATGNFDGLNLGDYINIPTLNLPEVMEQQEVLDDNGNIVTPYMEHEDARTLEGNPNYTNMRVQIVGFNHYRPSGNWYSNAAKPHVVMEFAGVPCSHWFNRKVKDPLPPDKEGVVPSQPDPWNYKHWNYWTKGDYNKSQMRAWLEKCFKPALVEAVGFSPLGIRRYIGTVGSWADTGEEFVFLPSNLEMLGNTGWATRNNGYSTGTSRQYALHAINPSTIAHGVNGGASSTYWLAEPSAGSSTAFCRVGSYGNATSSDAYYPFGGVPAFLIG